MDERLSMEQVTKEQLEKLADLREYLRKLGSVAVAFSGGVDSAFLLKAASDVLGSGAAAVTIRSCSFPQREFDEARVFCREYGIRHFVCEVRALEIEGFSENTKERCYLCKKEIFKNILDLARENELAYTAEGSNMDDEGDYRPGLRAVSELGIKSPLRDCGLTKADIRALSKAMGLPIWDKPSYACLASRFVYGEEITEEKLRMVDRAEQFLLDLGFRQVRVRIHGRMARIEAEPEEFSRLMKDQTRIKIIEAFREYGFIYTTLDLTGYRTGSMNEAL